MSAVYAANPRDLPMPLVGICVAAIVIGVISFFAGDPETVWPAFHVNWLFFGTMSQAALCISCAFVIIGARWAGPIRHVPEGLAAWVPISLVLFVIGQLGGGEIIHQNWIHGAPAGKESWLTFNRVFYTDLTILVILTALTLVYLKTSFRPTMNGAAERASMAKGLFQSWSAGWQGDEAEQEASQAKLRKLAPIVALCYAFLFTFVAFDQVMALTPTWFSNIFGWYFLWGGWLSAVAATALICVLLRATHPGWADEITVSRRHDLGKMIFAFSIFWMYLFFAQYIVIWYGNLPEETQFYQARLGSQFLQDTWFLVASNFDEPYVKLSLTAWAGCWIIPFWVLLAQRTKKAPAVLGSVAAAVLLGFWLERNVLVWPSLMPADGLSWLGGTQLGIAAGFAGAFVLVYLIFSRVFPTLPLPQRS